MAAQVSEQIAKDAVLWTNRFNGLFLKQCHRLGAESLNLRRFQLDASRVILEVVAAFRNSVCSVDFLALKVYQGLWLRTYGKPHPDWRPDQPQPRTLSFALLVNFPELEFRLRQGGDERQMLTQYVSELVADFIPYRPISASAPNVLRPWLDRQSDEVAYRHCGLAATLAADLDAAYPFPTLSCKRRDGWLCKLPPWSVPLPMNLCIEKYIMEDMLSVASQVTPLNIMWDVNTPAVRPILASSFVATIEQPTRLAQVPHLLQAYMQVHGFLCGWVWKMAETGKPIPFSHCLAKRRLEAIEAGTDIFATRHPMFIDGDAVARIREVELKEADE